MEQTNNYYTYAYLREDGTPYYIGKGVGHRRFSKNHRVLPPEDKTRNIVLKSSLSSEDACKHEVYMIFVLGRKDLGTGILRNMTDGGDGASGRVWTDGQKLQVSETMSGTKKPESVILALRSRKGEKRSPWSEEHRRKMEGKPSPFKGREHTPESKALVSKNKKGKPWSEARRKAQQNRRQTND